MTTIDTTDDGDDLGHAVRHNGQHVVEPTTIDTMHARPHARTACVVGIEGVRGTFELEAGVPLAIGRSRSSGIQVDDAAASRLHATLTWDGASKVSVEDHGSRNGTFVGEQRVTGTVAAHNGSIIHVGPARLLVVLPPAKSAPLLPGAMAPTLALADRASQCDLVVLLLGETGTGKEVLAQRIHQESHRSAGPFIAVNCGSIPETLAEAMLFGHERGSFTGATGQKPGVFEAAHRGTLFLDEIGELAPTSQARLLRVLEQHEIVRVGGTKATPVDVRVIAATHRDLDREVARGTFRRDLLYRIDVLRIPIPPLRERSEEIPTLVRELLRELGTDVVVEDAALDLLRAQPFPGNVRELRNVLARAIALGDGGPLDQAAIEAALPTGGLEVGALRGRVDLVEREAIEAALAATSGNQTHAAKRLGISRRALLYKMQRYGLGRTKGPRSEA